MGLIVRFYALGCGRIATSLLQGAKMTKEESLLEEMEHDRLSDSLPYLLAGLAGSTSGNQINSIAIQQTGLSGFRCVIRGTGVNEHGDPIHVVSFTTGGSAGGTLLLAEEAYRENLIKWKIDRFAENARSNGAAENEQSRLIILD